MYFIDYNSYLLESTTENNKDFQFFYHLEKDKDILHVVLLSDKLCLGYINFWKYINEDWEAISVVAEHGYGYKMFEAAMDFIYPEWFIPTRNKAITMSVIKTISKFIDRDDIETEKIVVSDDSYTEISEEYDDWFNRRYRLKNKLNINFKEVNYNFIKKTGIKLFNKMYPWGTETTID